VDLVTRTQVPIVQEAHQGSIVELEMATNNLNDAWHEGPWPREEARWRCQRRRRRRRGWHTRTHKDWSAKMRRRIEREREREAGRGRRRGWG